MPPAPTGPWSSGLSQGGAWALQLAAEHGDRVLGAVFICPSLAITDGHPARVAQGDPADLPASRVPFLERDPLEHWAKYDPAYWREHHEDFLWFFFGMCFPEPHSTKQIEDCVGLGARHDARRCSPRRPGERGPAGRPSRSGAVPSRVPCWRSTASHDLISPPSRGQRLAELTGGECVVLEGAGHIPLARDPVRVNLLLRDFARRFA